MSALLDTIRTINTTVASLGLAVATNVATDSEAATWAVFIGWASLGIWAFVSELAHGRDSKPRK